MRVKQSRKTITHVSASASVNPLTDFGAKKSGRLQYSIITSAAKIGYTEYRALDYKKGATREINKSYATGKRLNSTVKFSVMDGSTVTNPLDDYNSAATTRNYTTKEDTLDFMPLLIVKSDDYPDGILKAGNGSVTKKNAIILAKAMNVDLEDISKAMLGNSPVPQMGTPEWSKYAKAYRNSGGTGSEAAYRSDLVKKTAEKADAQDDITDISIGYFGSFHPDATVMPEALFYTLLACLKKTSVGNASQAGSGGTPTTSLGTARRFSIAGKLFSSVYSLNGYIHREVKGKVPGNEHGKVGHSTVTVHLDSEEPLSVSSGHSFHNDFGGNNSPYFNKQTWNNSPLGGASNAIPNMYVSIKVQTGGDKYEELVLVDFFQETTIDGKGKLRRSNSGNQSKNEKEMTWKEAYIAESFIPLTRSSMMKVSMLRRANLLIESKSHFIQAVNIQKTKVKWWQTGIFKAVVFVVMIVIAVISGGTLVGALINIAIGMAVSFALNALIKVLVDLGIISNAFAIALVAVVAVYAIAYGAGIQMDFTLSTTVLKTVEATGQVYAQELVVEQKEYQQKMAKIKEEQEELDKKDKDISDTLHTSSGIAALQRDIQRMLDEVTGPMREPREAFLARTLSKKVVTEKLTYTALRSELSLELI
jgi:hypothetical protein